MILCCTLGILVLINFFSLKYYHRFNISDKNNHSSLSQATTKTLSHLECPVDLYVIFSEDKEGSVPFFVNDLRKLLNEYYHFAPNLIRYRFINYTQQSYLVENLSKRYGHIESNSLIIAYKDRLKVLPIFDLYSFEKGELRSFHGNSTLNNELLKLTQNTPLKIGFTAGHGELDFNSTQPLYGLSSAAEFLSQNGYSVNKVFLNSSLDISSDLLIIAGAQYNFSKTEIEKISTYLDRGGKVLVLLTPTKLCGFEDLFYRWGILADDMIVVDQQDNHTSVSGENIINSFANHSITLPLIQTNTSILMGIIQPVRIDIGAPESNLLKQTPLFSANFTCFATNHYLQQPIKFNPSEDLSGPITLAVLAEKSLSETDNSQSQGKLLVIGNSSFINNNSLYILGNKLLLGSIVDSLLDQKNQTLNFYSQPILSTHLIITKTEFIHIIKILLLIPGFFAFLGVLVFIARRR